ncbi:MAG: PDZ domain-containing protein [Magnetovibrio sp.]|nr:PDZ domain-containing protein [Magnetovibrio sp.]
MSACVPAHQYAPLTLTSLDTGQSRTLDIAATGLWRDSAINLKRGGAYRITTSGQWSANPFCGNTDASGVETEHLVCMKAIFASAFPIPEARIGALVGKIGQTGTPFVLGGTEGFIAERDGNLFLRMNDPDGLMFDNTGYVEVVVQRNDDVTAVLTTNKEHTSVTPSASPTPQPINTTKIITPRIKGEGFYSAEQDIGFNVLDNVAFDAETGELTIAGHFDPKYAGPRIPYLQHLSVLLDYPKPQVSLDWTPEFERRVSAFFNRMDNAQNMASLVGSGQLIDANGRVTPKGRLFLPIFGVKAFEHGNAAGSLGVQTRLKEVGVVIITAVTPGSAADRAGLKVGDEIHMVTGPDGTAHQPHIPATLVRTIRFAGAGAKLKLNINHYGPDGEAFVTLDAYPGDSWEHMTRYDIIERIFRAGDKSKAANLIAAIGELIRNQDTAAGQLAMWSIMFATNTNELFERNRARYQRGEMPKDQMMADWMREVARGMERAMEFPHNSIVPVWENTYQRTGDPFGAIDAAIGEINRLAEPMVKEALRTALYKNDQITMPVSLLDPSKDFSPKVKPRYIGLPPQSELARLFVEADYVGKAVLHMPELSEHIPAYRTEYDYAQSRPGVGSETTNRLWIEPARIRVHRSRDNSNLRFGRTEMRINIARAIGTSVERYDDRYSRFLTRMYDDLSAEFYPLHELREASKLAVVARWIKSIAPTFTLPQEGRAKLSPPENLEGFVTLIWSPQRVKVSLIAPGGIDFNVPPIGPSGPVFPDNTQVNIPIDASVVDLRGISDDTTLRVDPKIFIATAPTSIAPRYRRSLTAPPLPSSVRLVGIANKGVRTLQRLDGLRIQTRHTSEKCDVELSRVVQDRINHAKSLARKLQGVEDALNAITSQAPERQRTYTRINKTLHEEQEHLRETALDLASSGLLGVYDEIKGNSSFRSIQDFETLIDTMRDAKGKLSDISMKLSNLDLALSSAMSQSLSEREQATKNLLTYIKDTLGEASTLTGNDATSRAFRTAGKTLGVWSKIQTALDGAESLYRLQDAIDTLGRLEEISETEAQGLRDSLLPLQRKLSDELDTAMNTPPLHELDNPDARLACGG